MFLTLVISIARPWKHVIGLVAIPSNRVNVSYARPYRSKASKAAGTSSQSPQIGSMFLTIEERLTIRTQDGVAIPSNRVNVSYLNYLPFSVAQLGKKLVAIPSNRVNVSYLEVERYLKKEFQESQSPQIGSMFLTKQIWFKSLNPCFTQSQSPQIGSMFLTFL